MFFSVKLLRLDMAEARVVELAYIWKVPPANTAGHATLNRRLKQTRSELPTSEVRTVKGPIHVRHPNIL